MTTDAATLSPLALALEAHASKARARRVHGAYYGAVNDLRKRADELELVDGCADDAAYLRLVAAQLEDEGSLRVHAAGRS